MTRLVCFRWFSATALVIGMLAATVGTALAAPPADQGLVPASGRLAGFTGGAAARRGVPPASSRSLIPTDSPYAGNGPLVLWDRQQGQGPDPLDRPAGGARVHRQAGHPDLPLHPKRPSAATLRRLRSSAAQPRPGSGAAPFASCEPGRASTAIFVSIDGGARRHPLGPVPCRLPASHGQPALPTMSSACRRPQRRPSSLPDGWR